MNARIVFGAALFAIMIATNAAFAQDAKAWLDSQGLEAVDSRNFQDFDVVVAGIPGAKDLAAAHQRVVIFSKGKPAWQSSAKDAEPGSKWTLHSIGRDLDGDGQPDVHFSSYSGGANCCTTHHVYRLKPQVRKLATYAAGHAGAADFIDVPGRKAPVMVSADDSSANVFAPYANSYFPMVVLEVSPKGRFQFASDLMQSRLPAQPPPICTHAAAIANPWLKERCNEYITTRRNARATDIKTRLAQIKSTRAADKLKWEDYYASGVLANRYTYTGHGHAGFNWLETIWPGNDSIKVRFASSLRQAQGKSVFAEDLKALASEYR
jgi:hypothetical protein